MVRLYILSHESFSFLNNSSKYNNNVWNFCCKRKFFFYLAPLPVADNGCDTKLFDLAKSVHWIVDESNDGVSIGSKRRRTRLGDDSEEEDLPPPPANDIYRQRQQKRVK